MTREEQIKAIYEKVADKTLSEGCLGEIDKIIEVPIRSGYFKYENIKIISKLVFTELYKVFQIDGQTFHLQEDGTFYNIEGKKCKIIGHPVMIGDVFDYLYIDDWLSLTDFDNEGCHRCSEEGKILYLWKEKRKSIEEQSDECIDYIYNLIK